MSCELCKNGGPVRLRTDSDIEMEFDIYCPMCGAYLPMINLQKQFEEVLGLYDRNKYVEIDGELLEIERRHTDDKPMDMKIDLDKVDISNEMEMLLRMNRKEKKDDGDGV